MKSKKANPYQPDLKRCTALLVSANHGIELLGPPIEDAIREVPPRKRPNLTPDDCYEVIDYISDAIFEAEAILCDLRAAFDCLSVRPTKKGGRKWK